MGTVQVIKVRNQGLDSSHHRKCFQHMLPYEISQIADRLHGDRLIEQVESLLIVDAESAPKGCPVGREGVMHLHLRHRRQGLSKRVDIRTEAGEMFGDVKKGISYHVETGPLPVDFLE